MVAGGGRWASIPHLLVASKQQPERMLLPSPSHFCCFPANLQCWNLRCHACAAPPAATHMQMHKLNGASDDARIRLREWELPEVCVCERE